ncbi:MAG TPA: DUF1800 domain-containing protein, partial [Chitinophagaceae bacterium]|nr:DUF1800 domain-containing protein [Chitinophagaceae bacterium]
MSLSNQQKNLHLLWRAGFGPAPADLSRIGNKKPPSLYKEMVEASAATPAYIDVVDPDLKQLIMGGAEMGAMQRASLSEDQKKTLRVKSRDGLKDLNLAWLSQMISSKQQLREKISLFWHGHFASRTVNIIYQQKLLDIVRTNALGSFAVLLKEVSKSASMINFLNNNQNRKDHPNENFAREVMELFTLGRGHYTEKDIRESARAFTGWGAAIDGTFVFRERQHDDGEKTFLGKTGRFTGDDILSILLEQKQTARFITQKIYRFFVNDVPDEANIEWLANRFYAHHYDIQQLMDDIFTSDWFYSEQNMGSRIKAPVELLAGIRRVLPMQIDNEASQLLLQRLLGQLLFYPPNVAGWPGGKNWIDSSTLMLRLRIPQLIYAGDVLKLKPKDDDDQMMGMRDRDNGEANLLAPANRRKAAAKGQQIQASIQW